jgi:hypothetical protein
MAASRTEYPTPRPTSGGSHHRPRSGPVNRQERLRAVYSAPDPASARRRLTAFYQHCAAVDVPELHRLARTIDAWSDAILAYHHTGLSNGPTEAVNLLIEKVRRVGHGFRNFDNYRLRLLLRCGVTWHTQPTARIRGHKPRKIA